ncbi:hypothetical protein ROZALSC1DRAFT_25578 [Rozella allomycis CSF55]|uniref:Uncharacterized protein n=1 Tax=Rozella allomycis (strain CSF55) TaxID=988480 RepID=A0A4P9YAN9_ROZAC|nr:hypothetical protein ROZALSC1DRAFT_25578 [Rozella allomycis CSF55]
MSAATKKIFHKFIQSHQTNVPDSLEYLKISNESIISLQGLKRFEKEMPLSIPPEINNISLPDYDEKKLKETVASDLNIVYLSPVKTNEVPMFPVRGKLFGENGRPFINLIVESQTNKLNVIFYVDAGSTSTHLSLSAMKELGFSKYTPQSCILNVHGVRLECSLSVNHFSEICVLGSSFMQKIRGTSVFDYNNETVTITSSIQKVPPCSSTKRRPGVGFSYSIDE